MERRRARMLLLVVALAAIVALGGAALMGARRSRVETRERHALTEAADRGPKVAVARASDPSAERTITLPGDVRAFWQTTLVAKVNGYVEELAVDRGERVRKGQVLARIASPETDQQVLSARSTLEVRRRLVVRARRLAPDGVVSAQELDQAEADHAVAGADLARLRALQEYEILRAPFDGTVTGRFVDPGALVSSAGQPVLEISSPGRVRVLVNVGQDAAPFVRLGDEAVVTIDQIPGLEVRARVRRTSGALDARSRSMLVEAWPEDGSPELIPGTFVHVALRVQVPPLPSVPAEAIVQRGERLQVATVRDGKLHFVDVETGASDGRTIQIRSGVSPGELVALSPPSDLGEGAPVQAISKEAQQRAARVPPAR
jgi:RND family efflux transporter MFP subunit